MANWISKQKGKVLSGYNSLLDHKTINDVPTSEVNKLWRARILINRATSVLPKDNTDGNIYTPNQAVGSGFSLRNPQRNPKLNEKTKDYDTLKSATDKRVQELQEHNQKLFLRITHQKEDKKKVSDDFQSKLLGDYAKMLDENELEMLRDLEEEL